MGIIRLTPSVKVALKLRDDAWRGADCIPDWVRGRSIGLDQFISDPKIAAYCWMSLQAVMKMRGSKETAKGKRMSAKHARDAKRGARKNYRKRVEGARL